MSRPPWPPPGIDLDKLPPNARAALNAQRQVTIAIEFTDATGARVTSVAHPFPPEIADTITGVRILPPGSE